VYVRFIALIDLFLFGVESQKRKELKAMSDAFKKWIDCSPFVINTGNEEKVAKLAWEASRASTFAEVARLREAIASVIDERHITGAEEFVVLSLTIEEYRNFDALSSSPAPAKTCRWYLQNALGKIYRTPHGQEVGLPYEMECPYCGLPIEEVKEETT
jgi:hypothetical protein